MKIQSRARLAFYWQNSNKTIMASNNAINTELVGSIVNGLKFLNMYVMPENIFYGI